MCYTILPQKHLKMLHLISTDSDVESGTTLVFRQLQIRCEHQAPNVDHASWKCQSRLAGHDGCDIDGLHPNSCNDNDNVTVGYYEV